MLEVMKATVRSVEGLKVEAEVRDFKITLDEPVELGGTNTGMNPVEAVLSGLGGCQVIVIKAFAQMKKFNVEEVKVELEGDIDPDGFMGKNPNVRNGFSEIRYTFHLKTNESEERAAEFIKFVEETCPVGDIVGNGVPLVCSKIVVE